MLRVLGCKKKSGNSQGKGSSHYKDAKEVDHSWGGRAGTSDRNPEGAGSLLFLL